MQTYYPYKYTKYCFYQVVFSNKSLLIFPVPAWFLSETKPFDFKGFSIMCAGFCTVSVEGVSFIILVR
jgi:hypothetical protein